MKASVITLQTSVNYGSVLQTYATMRVFERLGWQAEFVDYIRPNNTLEAQARRMLSRSWFRVLDRMSGGLASKAAFPWAMKRVSERAKPFKEFLERRRIPLSPRRYADISELRENPPPADVYCTGSDQVWNSIWNNGIDLPFYLDFVPEGKRKIAFAASIGREEIAQEEKEAVTPLLRRYHAISMREKSGVELLASMGIRSEWVLDPTLMLGKEEWLELAPPLPARSKGRLLLYVLNWNDRVARLARTVAKRYGWKPLRVTKNKPRPFIDGGMEIVVPGQVEELLGCFRDAACILTDSFHATAFSVNFHKPFIAVPPPRFPGRLASILQLTRLEDRMLSEGASPHPENPVDWNAVDGVLEEERAKTWRFLRNALDLEPGEDR